MNQLAIAIRDLNESGKASNSSQLTALERKAVVSIEKLIKMTPKDLSQHLLFDDAPVEWLFTPVPPFA